jgi:hypothetical protein
LTKAKNSGLVKKVAVRPKADIRLWYNYQRQGSGEVHINLLKDRLRIGLGVLNFDDASDIVFLIIGINDIAGLVYWLTS